MIRQQLHTRFFLFFCALALCTSNSFAQDNRVASEQALTFLQQHYSDLGLTQQDVADTRVVDAYVTKHNGVTHVWIQQQYQGIPVFNGLLGLHVASDGKVYHVGHGFIKDLQRKANTTLPSLSAPKALEMVMANVGFGGFPIPSVRTKINERNWVFEGGAISRSDISVSACYAAQADGTARLAWTMVIDQANTSDIWNLRVDALNGLVLSKFNQTQYCDFGHPQPGGGVCEDHATDGISLPTLPQSTTSDLLVDEKYNVFALPVASPSHGNRSVVTNPHDPNASPFGWLDTNGAAGAEYTYTRGNNVWAFDDSANDDTPSAGESADAGAGLNFDFPFDPSAEPYDNNLAAVTNLFYMNNKMHDITYRYGFDEQARNFQTNNYGNGGAGNDAVLAQALDGSGTNNANFGTPGDGSPGRMQMYVWNTSGGGIVKVNAPGVISGSYYGGQDSWGAAITSTPVTAPVVFVNDGIGSTVGCEPPTNDVTGKIVMIDRGECEFGLKALQVEQAGAVGCIICDHEAPPKTGFGAGVYGGQVSIPAVWMKKADCNLLRQYAGAGGLNISLVQPAAGGGPAEVDGDFDNLIIAHEYGHGISNRMTGTGNGCLGNPEQMGEGWSDFFSLVTTVRPGDTGPTKRGVGTYVYRQSPDANGIRRYPYSTDMSVNPLTFASVAENPEVHALGEIWTAMTWDLYWAMVEKYGYDADINNLNSGNARAIQLVMDGLTLQPCEPGFETGRDAIMLADKLKYQGVDTCLISSVFARRGLGYLATQNSSDVATDGFENFDPIPTCVKELKIKKITTTPLIEPGDVAEFVITVTNHKGFDAPNVVVTDELPQGLTLVSASNGGTESGGMVVWNLGTMPNGQVTTLTYTAKSAANQGSQRYFHDLMENEDNWYSLTIDQTNIEMFGLQSDDVHTGVAAWRANESSDTETDFVLETYQTVTITGNNPVLRFWHKYDTEPSADAGFLEFFEVDAPNPVWQRVTTNATFRNGYDGKVSYGTFALPNHYGFSGGSNGWKQSYFDMSAYSGKNITFRFRFGTDDNIAASNGGWMVDEVEIMNMLSYDTEACATSGSDHACDRAEQRGVIVEPAVVGTSEPTAVQLPMLVQPNPASDFLYVSIDKAIQGPVQLSLISTDGRVAMTKNIAGLSAGQVMALDVQNLPKGMYMIQLESAAYRSNSKVVIR